LTKNKNLKLVICQCFTNRALCYINLNRFIEALSDADFVISKLDDANVRAYHRRGISHMRIDNFEDALRDLHKVKELDPAYSNIEKDIRECMSKYD